MQSSALQPTSEWLTKQQAASLLQVSTRQVRRYVVEGRLQASRVSHKVVRIKRSSIERMLNRGSL